MKVDVDYSQLTELANKLKDSPDVIKAAKRRAFEDAAPKMKQQLDAAIGGSGKVRSWQEAVVGTKGGFAAVRPKAKTWTKVNGKGKRYAVGYVTMAINNGHGFSATGFHYKSVAGKHFYQQAEKQLGGIAQTAVDQVSEALKKHLEA